METKIKPDYYIKNIDGSFTVVHGCDTITTDKAYQTDASYNELKTTLNKALYDAAYFKLQYDIERGIVEDLENLLSEARAENELIKLLSISNKTYQCNFCGKSQCIVAPLNKEEIRQEAARECAEIATNRSAFELAKEIRLKFKLEV